MKTLVWLLLTTPLWAQVPNTDIFLATLEGSSSDLKVVDVKNITNRPGYDNQPAFRGNDAVLFTALHGEGDNANTDIFQYNIEDGKTQRLTQTSESEYSPTPMPTGDSFSVIRVEMDGTQRLWSFPFEEGQPNVVLPDVAPVGYHLWLADERLALFVLGEPHTLQVVRLNQEPKVLMPHVGRCLKKIPRQNAFSVVQRPSDKPWVLKRFDLNTLQSEELIAVKEGSEDYAWTPDGTVLMASDSQLFRWNPRHESDWVLVTDLEAYGLKQITRLAVSPDGRHLAMVAEP